jgi:predicted nucleic acid-binding Zn ribbon protein
MPPKRRPNARAKILAQWRGMDYTPLETARATPARRAGELLPALFKELRIESRQAEAEVVKVWNSLIDPAVTAHAQPANLHKGTLFVNVDSSVWLSEIVRYRYKEILGRLQSSFGKSVVQKISFRIGP